MPTTILVVDPSTSRTKRLQDLLPDELGAVVSRPDLPSSFEDVDGDVDGTVLTLVVSLEAADTYPTGLVRLVRERWPWVALLLIDGPSSAQMATATFRAGADDYLLKDESTADVLAESIQDVHRQRPFPSASNPVIRSAGEGKLIGTSDAMQPVFERIGVAHDHDLNVLLHGESGTGKTLTARAIHAQSTRSGAPFVSVDCRCLRPDQARRLFFGHTDRSLDEDRRPPVSLQDLRGGTVVLDHIDEMDDPVQDAFVHVLETMGFQEEAAASEPASRVRFIGVMSTSPPPSSFRTDLYYHLAELPIFLPPLRERPQDILPLARHFLKEELGRAEAADWSLTPAAETTVRDHRWPGNVRQLRNGIERAIHIAPETTIRDEDLILPAHPHRPDPDGEASGTRRDWQIVQPERHRASTAHAMNGTAAEANGATGSGALCFGGESDSIPSIEELKKQAVKRAYEMCDGDVDRAAVELGIGRSTMYRMLDRYGLKDD